MLLFAYTFSKFDKPYSTIISISYILILLGLSYVLNTFLSSYQVISLFIIILVIILNTIKFGIKGLYFLIKLMIGFIREVKGRVMGG